jgi:ribosomal protein L29
MAIIKKDIMKKMSNEEIKERLKSLETELIRRNAIQNKQDKTKLKEIKKAIARLSMLIKK